MPLHVRAAVVSLGLLTATVAAQTPHSPAIEVFSVKPSTGSAMGRIVIEPGGRFVVEGVPARLFLSLAFGQPGIELRRDQMLGLPDWIDTARFDVTIKAENPADLSVRNVQRSPQLPAFLRTVLADRFKLATHMEKRERPVYALVVKERGRLGADMHASSVDCATEPCGIKPSRECPRPSCLNDVGVTMDQFAYDLVNTPNANVDRMVLNRTNLQGRYDLTVRWLSQPNAAARAAGVPDVAPTDEVSIFSSIQDRLGLKLEATTAPVDTLIIDHIEKPRED